MPAGIVAGQLYSLTLLIFIYLWNTGLETHFATPPQKKFTGVIFIAMLLLSSVSLLFGHDGRYSPKLVSGGVSGLVKDSNQVVMLEYQNQLTAKTVQYAHFLADNLKVLGQFARKELARVAS